MALAFRCYTCECWVRSPTPQDSPKICPCGRFRVYYGNKVQGFYSEFWNEEKDIHHIYDEPRGV